MKKLKLAKKLLFSGALLTPALSLAALSCVQEENVKNYDFGLATDPINNLNYVKYKSVDRVLPSLVVGYTKSGPSSNLKTLIPTSSFRLAVVSNGNVVSSNFDLVYNGLSASKTLETGSYGIDGSFYTVDNWGLLGGLGIPSGTGGAAQASMFFFANPKNANNISAFTGKLNSGRNNVWSNGDSITAQDIRDYLEYILDINTGSQKLDEILKWGIAGSAEFVNAQKDYVAKYNIAYKNPWGRHNYVQLLDGSWIQDPFFEPWTPQFPIYDDKNEKIIGYKDQDEVDRIKKAALSFGFYTGQLTLDHSNEELMEYKKQHPNFKIALNEENITGQTFRETKQSTLDEIEANKSQEEKEREEKEKQRAQEQKDPNEQPAKYVTEVVNGRVYTDPKVISKLNALLNADTSKMSANELKDYKKQVALNTNLYFIQNIYANPYQKVDEKTYQSKIPTLAQNENSFSIIFDENKTPDISYLMFRVVNNLYPINRKYVETVAQGIDTYGNDAKLFLTTGPFKIENPQEDVVLGPQGFITLTKNEDYFDAANTISNKIKILFSTDKTINATFFEDGYISQTYIPANRILKYWSDKELKKYLHKNNGYGTIAFGFNLDVQSNGSGYLQDEDLRNFIYYSVNRDALLRIVGWDFSFPVNTWTAFGQYKNPTGVNIEMFFDGQEVEAKNGILYPLQNYDYSVHLSKSYQFEKTQRDDQLYAPKTAEFYLNRFKAKYPNLKNITLKFLNNSTDEQRKAGQYLQNTLQTISKDFVNVEIKSLPENTFASFIEQGKYDIIYQNYDKLGGNSAQDYVAVFFNTDELNALSQKSIGFKNNPVGSWVYSKYITNLLLPTMKQQSASAMLKKYTDLAGQILKENDVFKTKQDKGPLVVSEINTPSTVAEFVIGQLKNFTALLKEKLTNSELEKELAQNQEFASTLLEYAAISYIKTLGENMSIPNLLTQREAKLDDIYLFYYWSLTPFNDPSLSEINTLSWTDKVVNSNQQEQEISVTLTPESKWIDPFAQKEVQFTFADKIALANYQTISRLRGFIPPYPDIDDARNYFTTVISQLKNLSEDQKTKFIENINALKDVNQMRAIEDDALLANNDNEVRTSYLLDYKMRELMHWRKFVELSFKNYKFKFNESTKESSSETITEYTDRLNAFFTGNFTDSEFAQGWNNTDQIYQMIALLEKVVRDGSPLVPLMEVDTNWEITKIGGVESLFTFSLQYAYDITNPPRPGLPKKIGG